MAPLLEIRHLSVSFQTDTGPVEIVDDVSLVVPRATTVALVGESGCGKSVTALSILRLLPQPPARICAGEVLFHEPRSAEAGGQAGRDILRMADRELGCVRGGRIAMVFQEPMSSLNPVYTIGEQIVEGIELHAGRRGREAWDRAVEMLRRVGIADPARRARDYPHQLSGGMRQRAMIAMALACEPALLIADEPTTALDVTIQRQILELLRSLQSEDGMSLLLITHDFGVVADTADEVYVMYAGRIVEHARTPDILRGARHPYTQALLRCTPRLRDRSRRLEVIPGVVPGRGEYPSGCRFHPRCSLTRERAACERRSRYASSGEMILQRCVETFSAEPSGAPPLHEVRPEHFVACWEA